MVVLGGSGGLTVEASRGSAGLLGSAVVADVYCGPATWADVEFDSFLPPSVQTWPSVSQSVVVGSVMCKWKLLCVLEFIGRPSVFVGF